MNKVQFVLVVVGALVLSTNAAVFLDNESELREALEALFNHQSTTGWVLLNYAGPKTVHFAAAGEGGASEFVPYLEDDQIQYVKVRYSGIKEKGLNNVKIFSKFKLCEKLVRSVKAYNLYASFSAIN